MKEREFFQNKIALFFFFGQKLFWRSLIFSSMGGDRILGARGGASPPRPCVHVAHLLSQAVYLLLYSASFYSITSPFIVFEINFKLIKIFDNYIKNCAYDEKNICSTHFLLQKVYNPISCSTAQSWLPPPLARRRWKQPLTCWYLPTWAKFWHIPSSTIVPFPISVKLLDHQVLPHQVRKVVHPNNLVNFPKLVVQEANHIVSTFSPFKRCLEVTHNDKPISKLASGKQGLLQGCSIFLTLSTI